MLSKASRGQNIAEDVSLSGTVAAAIEGMALGIPSIALSQSMMYFHDEIKLSYETAEVFAPGIIARLEAGCGRKSSQHASRRARDGGHPGRGHPPGTARRSYLRHAEKRTDLRGRDYHWLGFKGKLSKPADGTDLRAIYDGRISVTPLHIDLTDMKTLRDLKAILGGVPPKHGAKHGESA